MPRLGIKSRTGSGTDPGAGWEGCPPGTAHGFVDNFLFLET
jgi:hypothetical protein